MSQVATLAAVAECKKMTNLLRQTIAKREATQKTYDDLMQEYLRKKGNYDAAAAQYGQRCIDNCRGGGVQRYVCDPMCSNIGLNVAPGKPEAPIYPDLGEFVCSICSQSVDISGSAGRDFVLEEKAINQQMTCTTNLENQINAQAAKDAAIAAQNAIASSVPSPSPVTNASQVVNVTRTPSVPNTTATAAAAAPSSKKTLWIVLMIVIVVIVGILIAILFVMGEDDETSPLTENLVE